MIKFLKSISLVNKLISDNPIYRKLTEANEAAKLEQRNMLNKQYHEYFRKYFNNRLIVRKGPFMGMKYLGWSSWSSVLPKLYGSYEEPIQKWIDEIIKYKYKNIIDIGCAEGYYLVGLGMKCPEANLYGYDIDNEALALCKQLAKLNKIEDRVILKNECNCEELDRVCQDKRTLVFCDIEGAEELLLDPTKAIQLKRVDILVETHDFLVKGITDKIIERFSPTHRIEIVVDYKRSIKPKLPGADVGIMKNIVDEIRPNNMKWIFMRTIDHDQ